MRKLIVIGTVILLSAPALSQSYNGPSPEETRNAVRDGILDALQDSGADMRVLSAQDIRDAVRDGILAADEQLRIKEGFRLFLQQQELMRQQEELAHRYRCKIHPSWACQ
jgi:flavin-binding protein dodecin